MGRSCAKTGLGRSTSRTKTVMATPNEVARQHHSGPKDNWDRIRLSIDGRSTTMKANSTVSQDLLRVVEPWRNVYTKKEAYLLT